MVFQISHADGDDLIAGEFDVPIASAAEATPALPRWTLVTQALPIAAALVGGLAIGFLAGRRRTRSAALLIAL
ncbi:hypothetical protein ACKI1O_53510, partial [Streptomyces scabiei]